MMITSCKHTKKIRQERAENKAARENLEGSNMVFNWKEYEKWDVEPKQMLTKEELEEILFKYDDSNNIHYIMVEEETLDHVGNKCTSDNDDIFEERYIDNWDILIQELEEKYRDVDIPENSPTVEEILALFDKHGNKLGLSWAKLSSS